MECKDVDEVLHDAVAECNTKLELVTDYLKRFEISDNRLISPIHDIEHCVDMMTYLMHQKGGEEKYYF